MHFPSVCEGVFLLLLFRGTFAWFCHIWPQAHSSKSVAAAEVRRVWDRWRKASKMRMIWGCQVSERRSLVIHFPKCSAAWENSQRWRYALRKIINRFLLDCQEREQTAETQLVFVLFSEIITNVTQLGVINYHIEPFDTILWLKLLQEKEKANRRFSSLVFALTAKENVSLSPRIFL